MAGPQQSLRGTRVLMGDDGQRTTEWLCRALQERGAQVQVASTAAGVEKELALGAYQLVVVPAALPDKRGLGVLAQARSCHIATPFLVVVGVSDRMLRIMVSDTSAQVLSSRTVSDSTLLAIAAQLLRASPARA